MFLALSFELRDINSDLLRVCRWGNSSATQTETSVGSLPASGSSNESISLTAPSAAGDYYYYACVDPVSGESDTENNCSNAVSVRVGDIGEPPPASFDLDSANDAAHGSTFANDRFYVVELVDDKVYAYTATGDRDAGADFDRESPNSNPYGIAFANGRFHVVDWHEDKVYTYTAISPAP